MRITPGTTGEVHHLVDDDDTAAALGSGDVPVLGTPRLLAWCEEATVVALAGGLDPAETSVGTHVLLHHDRATPVGARVTARASVIAVDGRLVRLDVVASHQVEGAAAAVVAHGEVTRAVVDRERFVSRLG